MYVPVSGCHCDDKHGPDGPGTYDQPTSRKFQRDPARNFSMALPIAIENHFRITKTVFQKFQPDFA